MNRIHLSQLNAKGEGKNPKLKIQNVQKSSNGENEINVIYFGYNSSPMCAAVRGNGDWCCCCRCCCRSKIKQLTLDLANAINSHIFLTLSLSLRVFAQMVASRRTKGTHIHNNVQFVRTTVPSDGSQKWAHERAY